MLKFFRRIRRKLLEEGTLKKYLAYSLGELLLIVIGILIALQINNWNENRQNRLKEARILHELDKNLQSNLKILENEIATHNETVRQIEVIIDYLDEERPLSDSLGHMLDRARWIDNLELTTSAFESLKSVGFDLIRSDTLRIEIINLFDEEYENACNFINVTGLAKYNSINGLYEKYFSAKKGLILPNDLDNFHKNQEFYNMLTLRRDWKANLRRNYLQLLNKTLNLKKLISEELAKNN